MAGAWKQLQRILCKAGKGGAYGGGIYIDRLFN